MLSPRVIRVIARLNLGGPAYHVNVLCKHMDSARFPTLLVHGDVGPGEVSQPDLEGSAKCTRQRVTSLTPEVRPLMDLRALYELIRIIRSSRPAIVETHTAKAGFVGRLAALLAVRPRPVLVHTYHGHVLEDYFGPWKSFVFRLIERALARATDCLICVSQATVDDLVRLNVAPRSRFRVVPLGIELDRFTVLNRTQGAATRSMLGAGHEDVLLGYVGRLVPIKRVDVIIRAVAELGRRDINVKVVIVGDGMSREELERLSSGLGVADRITFTGYLRDIRSILAACDIAILSSDNEGTPVSLIEAAAAGVPAVSTAVGGVPEVVSTQTGILVPRGDPHAFAAAVAQLATNPDLRARMARHARAYATRRFGAERLTSDMETLYQELLRAGAAVTNGIS